MIILFAILHLVSGLETVIPQRLGTIYKYKFENGTYLDVSTRYLTNQFVLNDGVIGSTQTFNSEDKTTIWYWIGISAIACMSVALIYYIFDFVGNKKHLYNLQNYKLQFKLLSQKKKELFQKYCQQQIQYDKSQGQRSLSTYQYISWLNFRYPQFEKQKQFSSEQQLTHALHQLNQQNQQTLKSRLMQSTNMQNQLMLQEREYDFKAAQLYQTFNGYMIGTKQHKISFPKDTEVQILLKFSQTFKLHYIYFLQQQLRAKPVPYVQKQILSTLQDVRSYNPIFTDAQYGRQPLLFNILLADLLLKDKIKIQRTNNANTQLAKRACINSESKKTKPCQSQYRKIQPMKKSITKNQVGKAYTHVVVSLCMCIMLLYAIVATSIILPRLNVQSYEFKRTGITYNVNNTNLGATGSLRMDVQGPDLFVRATCGQQWRQFQTGAIWKTPDLYSLNCKNVTATVLQKITTWHGSWCPWSGQPSPPDLGQDAIVCNQCSQSGGGCFWGHINTIGCMYGFGTTNNVWQQCTIQNTAPVITRTDGTTITSPSFQIIDYSNPWLQYPVGFYRNQGKMIAIPQGEFDPNSGTIGFQTNVSAMLNDHWTGCRNQADPLVGNMQTTVQTPSTLQCIVTMSMPIKDQWIQFNKWCNSSYIIIEQDQFTIMTNGPECNLRLRDSVTGFTQVISVSSLSSYTQANCDQWYCTCEGLCGGSQYISIGSCFSQTNPFVKTNITSYTGQTSNTGNVFSLPNLSLNNGGILHIIIILICVVIGILALCLIGCLTKTTYMKCTNRAKKD